MELLAVNAIPDALIIFRYTVYSINEASTNSLAQKSPRGDSQNTP